MADIVKVKQIQDSSGTSHDIAARSLLDSSGNEYTTGSFVKYAGNQGASIGSNAPFAEATAWATAEHLPYGNALVYDTYGIEWNLLYALNPGNLSYGAILRWGYADKYIYMARKNGSGWVGNAWEKIQAGYADNAGFASRADNAGYTWNGLITIGTWSRICSLYFNSVTGGSCLFTIKGTRGSVVYQGTFLIQTNHWSADTVSILCLSSSNYTSIKLRAISDGQGQNCYIEILDNASGSGTQTVNCTVLPLTKEANTPDLYATYHAGEIPSGYYSEEMGFGGSHGLSTSRRIKAGASLIGSGGTGSGDSSTGAKLEIEGGIITIKNYGNTFSIGQRNASFVHFENSNGATNYFGNNITVAGTLYPYTTETYNLGISTIQWNNIYGKTIYENGTALADKYLQLSNVSSAGNAAANTVVSRHADGSIQTEKLAVSSGTTTKATIQYNTAQDCIDFIFN